MIVDAGGDKEDAGDGSIEATGFFTRAERRWLARLRHPSEVLAGLQALRPAAAGVDGSVPETYEAELRDEDAHL